jgi:hypothetical protein
MAPGALGKHLYSDPADGINSRAVKALPYWVYFKYTVRDSV